MKTYPQLRELHACIREFREIYERKSMPLLYLFIDRYKKSGMKELSRFAEGLERDLDAVENSVSSPLWIYQCAESACPVFWKSPVRKEEIMVSDR